MFRVHFAPSVNLIDVYWKSGEMGSSMLAPVRWMIGSGLTCVALFVTIAAGDNGAHGGEVTSVTEGYHASRETAPYPPSPVIAGLRWAPTSEIVRFAEGSDNWPCTWADDDHLYTAGGDGNGFHGDRKSSWICRIKGDPPDITGEDLSHLGEGDGRRGRKACSLLSIDGVLYMFVRNVNLNGEHSQLAWSKDHGVTWEWADWRFEEFGYCVFVNYGKDYAGARDDYVYVVSHDNPSAYHPSDSMVLMRVPRDKLEHRGAYQVLTGLQAEEPTWSSDFAKRRPVFKHHSPWMVRSSISYNPGLKRYLWWHQVAKKPRSDTRREGGFAIYDAPEPWGPWTTVYYTERWDTGPGDTGCFPTKWMSEDGREAYLVFSGRDALSIRKVLFVPVGHTLDRRQ